MMHQSEWELLSLCVILSLKEGKLSILTPEKAQAIEFESDGEEIGEEIRKLSVFEEHYAKVINGKVCSVNGRKYLILNKTYFSYGYDYSIPTACSAIFRDGYTLIEEYNS